MKSKFQPRDINAIHLSDKMFSLRFRAWVHINIEEWNTISLFMAPRLFNKHNLCLNNLKLKDESQTTVSTTHNLSSESAATQVKRPWMLILEVHEVPQLRKGIDFHLFGIFVWLIWVQNFCRHVPITFLMFINKCSVQKVPSACLLAIRHSLFFCVWAMWMIDWVRTF